MLNFATRIFFIGFALFLILDPLLPKVVEHVAIDRHRTHTSRDANNSRFETKHYTLAFENGTIGSCDVGYSLYSKLEDGDEIRVSATRLMKRCSRIEKDGKALYTEGFVWTLSPLVGVALILASFGVLGLDRRISIKL